jgi:hypothetical protein
MTQTIIDKLERADGPDRRVRWFSEGAASAVATMLDIQEHGAPAGPVVTCSTGAEDDDNKRFRAECEIWFGKKVEVIGSEKYESTWDVWRLRNYMAGVNGAVCTGELKVVPRLNFQLPSDINVFGYTADKADVARAKRLRETYPLLKVSTPLIDRNITKANCLALIESAGLTLPRTYAMGFPNANCLKSGCCKATSPDYWSLHRKCFPSGFAETAAIARHLGVRLARVKGERVFIDDIPADWPVTDPIAPSCDLLCAIHQDELEQAGPAALRARSQGGE